MTNTAHLSLSLLFQNQAQKEITVNESFIIIDAMINTGVKTKALNRAPQDPQSGELYIISQEAVEIWAEKDQQLAFFEQGWRFIKPNKGLQLWVNDEDVLYQYNGINWIVASDSILQEDVLGDYDINLNKANIFELTLKNDCNILMPKDHKGLRNFTLIIKQDELGGKEIFWPKNIIWSGNIAPKLSAISGSVNIIRLIFVGSGRFYGQY